MDPPSLKLMITQGPREGETLIFPAGSTVRIGRVVRGNNLTIKDGGISSKHLTIQWDPHSSKWTLTDLDSSNGTILNSVKLSAHTPTPLHDGDTIKLGEWSSIMIKMNAPDESRLRRNPRRHVTAKNVKIEVVEVEDEGKLEDDRRGIEEKPVARGRRRPRKVDKVESVRVTRGRKELVPEIAEVSVVVPGKTEVELGGKEDNEVEKTGGGGGGRRRKIKEEEVEIRTSEETVEIFGLGREGGEKEKNKERVCGVEGSEGAVIRGNVAGSCNRVKEGLDFERMTLGEWFDFMEVNLPKQIIEATEELIEGMRKKAKQVKEYMIEKKKEKGKVHVG
ncbi:FHA domain-containing protein [Cephalotus follicularis]|uniref:FHA domain-containing protein n=1 Tax=Cephalotus follicularis TaxID=3775 RepID=A0A1Q3BNI7_CEPFO|nr:FHA domain-containing protein [Cephalotus follicularis]